MILAIVINRKEITFLSELLEILLVLSLNAVPQFVSLLIMRSMLSQPVS